VPEENFWTLWCKGRLTEADTPTTGRHSIRTKQCPPPRGNKYKLQKFICHYKIRKYSFCAQVFNFWNSLPSEVVEADTVNAFKYRLDKYCSNQDVLFDFNANLKVICNDFFGW